MAEYRRRPFPIFRYHPFPVYTRAIEAQPITCPVCGEASAYSYAFTYAPDADTEEQEVRVCPWCLHDGSAARRYPGVTFVDPPPAPEV
ncbi:MAG TPA: CbrC family protein, partial [Chloroflexota bacterium]|nr:CbrC family protein [Chloroflexota bacterium]